MIPRAVSSAALLQRYPEFRIVQRDIAAALATVLGKNHGKSVIFRAMALRSVRGSGQLIRTDSTIPALRRK